METTLQRILYVEDEADIQAVARMALETVGKLTVKICASGEEALREAAAFAPDMILLDVMMPGMDGPTTLDRLRQLPELAGVPVAFMTAKVQPNEVEFLKSLGAVGVIPKPFDPMQLPGQVRALWGKPAASDMQSMLTAELARLRNDYLAKLPAELSSLATLAGKLSGSDADRQLLEQLHHRLHKLAGSGGTFGLHRLSKQARRLEQEAKMWLGGAAADKAAKRNFAAEVESLPSTLSEVHAAATPQLPAAAISASERRIVHLWLVDEDEKLGLELQFLLNQFGYDVKLFSRLKDAEAAVAQEQPDVLIMDITFTQGKQEPAEEMLKRPPFHALRCPILFITACDDFASRLRAVRMGAQGLMLKPLDVPRLVDLLEQIFEQAQQASYRILIVDDDEVLSAHYRLVLMAAGMEVEVLNQPDKVIERVAAFHPELVLMDMQMPDYSGPELAAVIRQHESWIGLPIIYLSAETDVDEQIKAMGVGADDFLTKPISDTRLAAAVTVRAARARQLSNLMSRDSLTGLLKHARIKEELELELARARRNGKAMSVVMMDIDHFKKINDTHGHAVGDRVIRAVAHLLRQRLRKSDIVGRYGGEEFVAVLPECDVATAQQIMNDIRERFSTLRFHNGFEFGCTLSAGLACNQQFPEASSGELLVFADEALYQAKHGGRNRVCAAGLAS